MAETFGIRNARVLLEVYGTLSPDSVRLNGLARINSGQLDLGELELRQMLLEQAAPSIPPLRAFHMVGGAPTLGVLRTCRDGDRPVLNLQRATDQLPFSLAVTRCRLYRVEVYAPIGPAKRGTTFPSRLVCQGRVLFEGPCTADVVKSTGELYVTMKSIPDDALMVLLSCVEQKQDAFLVLDR